MPDLSFLNLDTLLILIFSVIFVGLVIGLVVSVRRAGKHPEKIEEDSAEAIGETDDDGDETDHDLDGDEICDEGWMPPEPEAFPARVVDMRVVTGNVGTNKRPRTEVSFLVTFLTDDGRRTEYPVPEELYVTLDIDQTGTLVILNGGFFDFGSGEEYDPAAVEEFEKTFDPSDGDE